MKDRAEQFYQDYGAKVNVERILEQATGVKVEMERMTECGPIDVYFEMPYQRFVDFFGDQSIAEQSHCCRKQARVVCEIHGETHICQPSGRLNLKTIARMKLLGHLGYAVTYLQSNDIESIARADDSQRPAAILQLLKLNLVTM